MKRSDKNKRVLGDPLWDLGFIVECKLKASQVGFYGETCQLRFSSAVFRSSGIYAFGNRDVKERRQDRFAKKKKLSHGSVQERYISINNNATINAKQSCQNSRCAKKKRKKKYCQ